MRVTMRIKGLKTNETSFKNAQDENQTEDTSQNLEYDNVIRSLVRLKKTTAESTSSEASSSEATSPEAQERRQSTLYEVYNHYL